MTPIVFALVPTIAGAGGVVGILWPYTVSSSFTVAILIGLNGSGKKGALLFGKRHIIHMTSTAHPALAVYLVASFGSALSTVYAYNASNTAGHTKKSTINAMTLVAFSIGNIVGTETFLPKDAPDYIPGKITIMVLLTIQLGVCFLLRWINIRLNVKKRAKIVEEKARRGWSDAEVQRERERHAFADLTDKEYVSHFACGPPADSHAQEYVLYIYSLSLD